jgi:hypothetical protein
MHIKDLLFITMELTDTTRHMRIKDLLFITMELPGTTRHIKHPLNLLQVFKRVPLRWLVGILPIHQRNTLHWQLFVLIIAEINSVHAISQVTISQLAPVEILHP